MYVIQVICFLVLVLVAESRKVSRKEEAKTTQIKLRGDKPAPVRRTSLNAGNRNFNQIINKLTPETQGRVLIARADEKVEVRPSQTLAKVWNLSLQVKS